MTRELPRKERSTAAIARGEWGAKLRDALDRKWPDDFRGFGSNVAPPRKVKITPESRSSSTPRSEEKT